MAPLTRNDLIGIIVVPGALALAFVLLAVFYFLRHWLYKILLCFWNRDLCLRCRTETCERLMHDDGGIYVTDSQLLDSGKSVPHTLSVELTLSGSDKEKKVDTL